MKALIVEDDLTSRLILQEIMKNYGTVHVAVNGQEAVDAVRLALEAGDPYDLICLDILMPEMDGHEALEAIRKMEEENGFVYKSGSKIIMTTALDDLKNVTSAYSGLCDGYLTKPIEKAKLEKELSKLALIS